MSPVSTEYKVSTNKMINISDDNDDDKSIEANHWVKVRHKEILIEKEHLNNHHMTAAQKLMQQFPNITSLQNTLRKIIIPYTENG